MNTGEHPIGPRTGTQPVGHARTSRYEIRVRGRLGNRLAAWFDGLELSDPHDGTTVIRGPVADQAALHGLLHRLRDLGIPLVSLAELPPEEPASPADRQEPPTDHTPGATP